VTAVRRQIGNGADIVKLYADYRWGPGEPSRPTFTQAEMTAAVEAAHSAGRQVTAHASTPEGMRRAILAGVDAIEHGSEGTAAEFKLMRERGVALCPPLAAGDAIARYRGWNGAIRRRTRWWRIANPLRWRGLRASSCAWAAMSGCMRMATMPARCC